MSILPLPVFEADADPHQRDLLTEAEAYERLEPPKTIVVKYGLMGMIGEFPYGGKAKPGCGSKLVARTPRGTEVVEMLTTTCENAGCGKSVTRNELLDYIDQSGGRDFPFFKNGRVIRVATIEDLNRQSELDTDKSRYISACRRLAGELGLQMKLVEVEPILGDELLTFYYMADERVDFRELVRRLATEFKTRIEMRQVGARDEARLTADYERCGQYCCCKNFLKVLKPVSMKSAKIQKATLDPLKISGRCGRLMCCLRYEDQTYTELRKALPRRQTRVGTPEGPGVVIDGKILVQLVLVRLEHDAREIAVPVEELMDPDECPAPGEATTADPLRGMPAERVEAKTRDGETPPERRRKSRRRRGRRGRKGGADAKQPAGEAATRAPKAPGDRSGGSKPTSEAKGEASGEARGDKPKRRRRRRGGRGRRGRGKDGGGGGGGGGEQG
jgi:cell fate regulator YaaT (PSP1 superfamily)